MMVNNSTNISLSVKGYTKTMGLD